MKWNESQSVTFTGFLDLLLPWRLSLLLNNNDRNAMACHLITLHWSILCHACNKLGMCENEDTARHQPTADTRTVLFRRSKKWRNGSCLHRQQILDQSVDQNKDVFNFLGTTTTMGWVGGRIQVYAAWRWCLTWKCWNWKRQMDFNCGESMYVSGPQLVEMIFCLF